MLSTFLRSSITILCLVSSFKVHSQTLDSVYSALVQSEIKHPQIVLKQVKLETGNLKCSKCSQDYNNLFGFFYKGAYLKFDTWEESVAYYKRWQDKYYKGGDYYQFLINIGYATDKNYINKLKQL